MARSVNDCAFRFKGLFPSSTLTQTQTRTVASRMFTASIDTSLSQEDRKIWWIEMLTGRILICGAAAMHQGRNELSTHHTLRAVERDKTIALSISGSKSKHVWCMCNASTQSIRDRDRKHRGMQRHPADSTCRMKRSIRSPAKKYIHSWEPD